MSAGTLGVVLAGGGTGGHIHPNLAVAEALERLAPGRCRAVFLVSDRAIDARVLSAERVAGAPPVIVVSPAKPLGLRPRTLTRFVASWGGSVRAARHAIGMVRGCDRVAMLATGGFVSAPAIVGARAERIERAVVNLDAVPGKANRLAARFATAVFGVGARNQTGVVPIAPIVRRRLRERPPAEAARAAFGLDPLAPTLLITGGSQGARSVNSFVLRAWPGLAGASGWQIIHQTGDGEQAEAERAWAALGVRSAVAPYIDRMDLALAAADAAVCRGGAGAIADLWATATPALILPYPYHHDEHQRLNAAPLASAGGAIVATDHVNPERNVRANADALAELLDPARRAEMRRGLEALGPADGADRLAAHLLGTPVG
jgi:UDP-N-acetylglucosamine--N-acetylmuramyl-(pentapeptide) pyrophosphoryl-undecaprenol N-acetylglucosamine transferase